MLIFIIYETEMIFLSTETIMQIVCILGVIAFAVSGAMVAIDKRADPFGVIVLAVITATGGGIVRDILLGIFPPKIFLDSLYVIISIITALTVFLAAHLFRERYRKNAVLIDSINNVFDALGLGVFVVIGAQSAIDYGFSQNGFLVLFIAMITGIGGGFLRDIMVQEIPFVLKKRIYALAALAGGLIFYILYINKCNYTLSVLAGTSATFILRMSATHFHWDLPPAY